MNRLDHRIGVVGAGNMGEAMMGAMIRSQLVRPEQVCISDIRPERLLQLEKAYGVSTTDDNRSLFMNNDVVVVAVKPQQIDALLDEITVGGIAVCTRKLVISIAAGITLKRFEDRLYATLDEAARQRLPIVRVMPNTPALVLAGMTGMSPNANAAEADVAVTRAIFEAMGRVNQFDEKDLDAVTALSGSGPAYVFYLAEAMIAGGVAAGLDPDAAATLSLATLEGAVKLMAASQEPPETLRQRVTSPGGTTEAAVGILDRAQVHQHIVDAIVAAAERARELSR
ncbi:MAG: pyrroline-5-carboxylate reductase [Desulfobacterales bacterium]|nr:pyrroline-5-carboxylate reductase [Desulfobacterales bacterium]